MARDTDSIERDIESARNQLAGTLDELALRANPKRVVENTKQTLIAKLNQPAVKYGLIAAGTVIGLLVVRKVLR
ncbi:DUF3618 domain-containing protein [Rhodococcus triatomae]|uniref:DUF3618 domain-containing protein n=1 Tax=Rhodococcus triatomae TaxID=300028 RepID=A0A1G8DZC3_9NOCA|nr:DUF3618 domain-containing protein [Rhodococcus triatomae]QNG18311.1 DUF3618 domain-containing protein [Rhodococcus triatomae]QNG22019.1 DUF3618 domain-containing protein [Rhodococcus triatomae]SDH62983.1 Protein of unknown function [Rhodococcus triatomae]